MKNGVIIWTLVAIIVAMCIAGCGNGTGWQKHIVNVDGKQHTFYIIKSVNHIENDSLNGYASLIGFIEPQQDTAYLIHIPAKSKQFSLREFESMCDMLDYSLSIKGVGTTYPMAIHTDIDFEKINLEYGYSIDMPVGLGAPNLLNFSEIVISLTSKKGTISMEFKP